MIELNLYVRYFSHKHSERSQRFGRNLNPSSAFPSIKTQARPGALAQACDPTYLGGRDQEDHGSRSAWAISS
jgi:hypothetical protein